jgi:Cu/Ag efflux protein CusF
MKKEIRIAVSTLASLILVPVFWARPATHSFAPQDAPSAQAAQTQSVSGKIASVDKNAFTLTVQASGTQQFQQTAPTTMTFTTDKNTTIDGKLKVGSSADVTYRDDNGTHLAVSVHVTP